MSGTTTEAPKKSMMQQCKEFEFNLWSRVLAILGACAMMVTGIFTIGNISGAIWMIVFALLVFCIEIPFCCKCCLNDLIEKLKWLEATKENPKGALIRGTFYFVLDVIGFLIVDNTDKHGAHFFLLAVMLCDSICYWGAYIQDKTGGKGMAGGSNKELGRGAAQRGVKYAKDNPEQTAAAAGAAMQFAADNPEVARQAATTAATANKGDEENPWA